MHSGAMESEAASLFNPAFCAVLLNRAVREYEKKSDLAFPLTYAFLILPSALHTQTRKHLPSRVSVSMWPWIRSHPDIMLDFAERARNLQPFISDAIKFGLQYGVLTSGQWSLYSGKLERRPRSFLPTTDWQDCLYAAEFLGRWFGSSEMDELTMMTLWGVKL